MKLDHFQQLDENDPLAAHRQLFYLPEGRIYLDGNSLGALPHDVRQRVEGLVRQEWGQDLISSWNQHDWIALPRRVGEKIAPLIGAAPGQVICADSISVNLFKLLATALELSPGRRVILSESGNFPTDLYVGEGLAGLMGPERCELRHVPGESISEALDGDVAVLMLTHVNFRDGSMHDIRELTRAAHECGALVLWDLAHSAGAMPVELDACDVDMAVGCGYKYLNGGPGAPAFLYLASRHQEQAAQPLSGWMGHQRPFEFENSYEAASGIDRYLSGTPGILGMAALDTALDVFEGVSTRDLRRKSITLTQAFIDAVLEQDLPGIQLLTPQNPDRRGSHVSLAHPHGFSIAQALIERGIIVDFRAPDIVRFGFAPLYNRFIDAGLACQALSEIIHTKAYRDDRYSKRSRVT